MIYQLLAARKAAGDTLDLSTCTTQVSWSTQRTGTPGTLKFTYIRTPACRLEEGDVIRFSVGGVVQFYGWVFRRGLDRWGPVDVTCYDRLRYLKANASYSFYGQSAGDIIRRQNVRLVPDPRRMKIVSIILVLNTFWLTLLARR